MLTNVPTGHMIVTSMPTVTILSDPSRARANQHISETEKTVQASVSFSLVIFVMMIYNNYSMSPSWIWSDKLTNERVARVGYNHLISNKGEWNNCFSKFSNRVLRPIFISTILQSVRKEKTWRSIFHDVKLRLLARSRSFLANQKARNAIVGAENLLKINKRAILSKLCNLGITFVFYVHCLPVSKDQNIFLSHPKTRPFWVGHIRSGLVTV